MIKPQIILLTATAVISLLLGGCRPKLESCGPLNDGAIVLLRTGGTRGAFILAHQTQSPELTDYQWFLRSDGKGTFDPGDPAVKTGMVTRATDVRFGPFTVDWSTAGNGRGYVYYPWGRGLVLMGRLISMPGGPMLALTSETNITKVDANSKQWAFRRVKYK